MPKDMQILVEVTQGILTAVERRLDFLHMPVPKDRTDETYFTPLKKLNLDKRTQFFLGLIHHDDHAGDLARIKAAKAAKAAYPEFGISSECGWGRTDPERVPGLIAAHRQVMEG